MSLHTPDAPAPVAAAPRVSAEARASWSGKWAFILAGAGSAVGLGNMWRFPYLAAKYGGGAFLIVYLALVFTFGVSLLLLETSLGRKTRQSAIGAYAAFGRRYGFIGALASAVPFIIGPYYCIIGGWVLKYLVASIAQGATPLADGGGYFVGFITGGAESFVYALVFAAIVCVVVARGVKGGVEKANLVLMPALVVLAVVLAVYALTLPGALEGAVYYMVPDFSKFSPELVVAALGQMFFSLSIAMGIMVTFGSYLDEKSSLTQSVARIGCFDVGVSFLAGLMIVPAAFAALGGGDAVAANSGPSLMFVVLPQVFDQMGGLGRLVAAVFFLLVLFAAVTSCISVVETCVSIVQDGARVRRRTSMALVFSYTVVGCVFVNMGYNVLSGIEPLGAGSSLLDLFDFIANSVLMPVVALLTCLFVGWIVGPHTLAEEVRKSGAFRFERPWTVMVKFVAPVLVAVVMVAYIAAQFGLFSM